MRARAGRERVLCDRHSLRNRTVPGQWDSVNFMAPEFGLQLIGWDEVDVAQENGITGEAFSRARLCRDFHLDKLSDAYAG